MKSFSGRPLAALTVLLLLSGASAQLDTARPVAAAPTLQRTSTVSLPFDAPTQAQELVLAQALPEGATFISGSTRLNGRPLPDPQRGPSGTLYWRFPAQGRGLLTYEVSHIAPLPALPEPALLARFPGERSEVLQGRMDPADLKAAVPLDLPPAVTENAGAIKLPLAGSVIRIRDRITVEVEAPLGAAPALTVNGVAVGSDRVGTQVQDAGRGVQRLTYVGVPLQPGPNVLRFGADEVRVVRAGPTARVEVTPLNLTADGSTPIRLKLRTLDAYGTPATQATLTVRTNLEPRTPDANPGEAGYQIKLEDGEGLLELQPQAAPTTLKVEVLLGEQVLTSRYEITPDRSSVGVGVVSATLGLNGGKLADNLSVQARAYAETPLGAGKLYVAADKDGLPKTDNPNVRSPVFGDASTAETPLQGLDPVAAVYDHPAFRAVYRQTALPISVLPVGEQLTALTVVTKSNPSVSAFVAGVPEDRVSELQLTPDGTRILRLPNTGLVDSSETLEVVTLEARTGKELDRRTLTRNVDYIVDYPTGIVTLVRPLERVDADFNDVRVLASYRLLNGNAGRHLAYGVQVRQEGKNSSLGAAVVNLDGKTTFGVRGTFDNGLTRADTRLAYSGGVQASADLSARFGDDTASLSARYQDAGYQGLAPFNVGLNVAANYTAAFGPNLRGIFDG